MKAICERCSIKTIKQPSNTHSTQQYIVGGKAYTIQDIYSAQVLLTCQSYTAVCNFLGLHAVNFEKLASYSSWAVVASLSLSACRMSADKSLNLLAQQQQPSNASAVITAAPRDIRIVYPNDKEGLKVPTSSTFIVGACPPQAELLCNGEKIRINAEGYFAHVVSLAPGANTFVVTEVGHPDENQTFKIVRDIGRTPIPANKFELAIDTAQPAEDLGVESGDKIELSVRATPGSEVYAIIGGKKILLRSFAASHALARAERSGVAQLCRAT